ncbi:MAG: hypothetical protein MJ137_06380 [Clostridia bacterium]|nr:hypothetical protein [Clostridia bacterium]
MGERLHSGVSAGNILGKFAVYLKYAMPSVSVVCSVIFCSLSVWRLSNDGTVREKQSVFGLAAADIQPWARAPSNRWISDLQSPFCHPYMCCTLCLS